MVSLARFRRGAAASALLVAALTAGGANLSLAAGDDDLIVNCYDAKSGVVQKKRAGTCRGTAVSDERAAAIRARREAYIRRAFSSHAAPVAPGKRLAGVGSGFFVSTDGVLVTNYHVIKECKAISLSPASGGRFKARLVTTRRGADLALLRAEVRPAGIATFAADKVGNASGAVRVIGYPDQGIPPIKPLLTRGRAAGTRAVGGGHHVLQIKAEVRPGNSGGPLLDERGRVIGVVFAKIDTPGVYKRTGAVVRGLAYAIPESVVRAFLDRWRVPYRTRTAAAAPLDNDPLKTARAFVARVECWK